MNNKKQNIEVWLAAIGIYAILLPYFLWSYAGYMGYLVTIPLSVIFFRNLGDEGITKETVLFCLLCVFAQICATANIFGIIMCVQLGIIFSAKKEFLADVYSKFRLIYAVIIGLSLISYFLVQSGVPLPSEQLPPPPHNTMNQGCTAYPLYVIPNDFYDLGSIFALLRFNGPFDEPGVVGTISLLLLTIERFNLRKIGNIIILVSGIFSYSLFFYVAAFIYLGYYAFFLEKRFFAKIICAVLLFGAVSYASTNEAMSNLILSRVEWDKSSNSISGDDRATYECKQYVESIRGTSKYYFGSQDPNLVKRFNAGSSIQNVIVQYGFVTLVFFMLFYFLYARRNIRSNLELLIFVIVFFVTLYTRPTLFSYYRLFLQNILIIAAAHPLLFQSYNDDGGSKKWYQIEF